MTDIDDHNDPFAGYEGRLEPSCTTCAAAAALAKWCPTNEENPF